MNSQNSSIQDDWLSKNDLIALLKLWVCFLFLSTGYVLARCMDHENGFSLNCIIAQQNLEQILVYGSLPIALLLTFKLLLSIFLEFIKIISRL